jgi:signal transduction histidine kinase
MKMPRALVELLVHDLRSPVAAVLANAELLGRSASGEQRDMVDDILAAAQQIERTAKDLLDVSRAEAGQLSARLQPFRIAELVEEVAVTMRGVARWTNIDLQLAVHAGDVIADPELTRRMLQNLVFNAIRHAPERSVVRLEAALDGEALLLRVADEGPAIAAADAERLFDRHALLDSEPVRTGGHGLGLAFCRLAAEAHGGRIWVEPGTERGAVFCVHIPQPLDDESRRD